MVEARLRWFGYVERKTCGFFSKESRSNEVVKLLKAMEDL